MKNIYYTIAHLVLTGFTLFIFQFLVLRVHLFLQGMKLFQNYEFQKHKKALRSLFLIISVSILAAFAWMYFVAFISILHSTNDKFNKGLGDQIDKIMTYFAGRELTLFVFSFESILLPPYIAYLVGFSTRRQVEYFSAFNRLQTKYSIY